MYDLYYLQNYIVTQVYLYLYSIVYSVLLLKPNFHENIFLDHSKSNLLLHQILILEEIR